MSQITNIDAVAIAQVTVYGILLLLDIQLFALDGFWKSSPWFFILLFCVLRIIGASLQLSTIDNAYPIHLELAAAICSSIGLSILFLIAIELLRRINRRCYKYYLASTELAFRLFNIGLHLIILTGLILGIVGGVQTANHLLATGQFSLGILLEVSSILFIVALAGILGITGFAFFNWTRDYVRNPALLVAVVLSLPFLIIRLVYNALGYIAKDLRFNPVTGVFGFYVGFSFVPEVVAVVIYLWGGYVNVLRRRRGSSRSRSSKSRSYTTGSRSRSSRTRSSRSSRSRSRTASRSHSTRS